MIRTFRESSVLWGRLMRKMVRVKLLLFFALFQPLLFLLLFIVPNREFFDENKYNERAKDLVQAMVERYSTAILDADAGEFLED